MQKTYPIVEEAFKAYFDAHPEVSVQDHMRAAYKAGVHRGIEIMTQGIREIEGNAHKVADEYRMHMDPYAGIIQQEELARQEAGEFFERAYGGKFSDLDEKRQDAVTKQYFFFKEALK